MHSDLFSTTKSFCPVCRKQTPHQIRRCEGAAVRICLNCLTKALFYSESKRKKGGDGMLPA